jgi:hypothetical protein
MCVLFDKKLSPDDYSDISGTDSLQDVAPCCILCVQATWDEEHISCFVIDI